MTRIPAARNTAPDACVKLASRSCSTNFGRVPASPRSMSRFRACWMTRTGPGAAWRPGPGRAGAVLDHGQDVDLRAVEQVSGEEVQRQDPLRLGPQELRPARAVRRGAGSIPASLRICQTVDGATVMPG